MTPAPPPLTVLQRLGQILGGLLADVSVRVAWGGLPMALNVFIAARIEAHRQRIARIVERIRAGTYTPHRRASPKRTGASRPPRRPSPIRQSFGWLMPLIPPYWQANAHRNAVEALLSDPEMVELIAAAPSALGRPLRSLCWMLRIKPPPILARPRKEPTPPETPQVPAAAVPVHPPPPDPTDNAKCPPLACGPPIPA
jgi:hypothetical protein